MDNITQETCNMLFRDGYRQALVDMTDWMRSGKSWDQWQDDYSFHSAAIKDAEVWDEVLIAYFDKCEG